MLREGRRVPRTRARVRIYQIRLARRFVPSSQCDSKSQGRRCNDGRQDGDCGVVTSPPIFTASTTRKYTGPARPPWWLPGSRNNCKEQYYSLKMQITLASELPSTNAQ